MDLPDGVDRRIDIAANGTRSPGPEQISAHYVDPLSPEETAALDEAIRGTIEYMEYYDHQKDRLTHLYSL